MVIFAGGTYGGEYFAGWVTEKSLSVDNLFVFVLIMAAFAVPRELQQKVLLFGIAFALVLRTVFILIGAALLASFYVTFYLFGALLLYTAWKLVCYDEPEIEPEHNPALKLLRRRVPMTADYYGSWLTVREAGHRIATLLAAKTRTRSI